MLVLSNFELRSAFYRPYFSPSNCFELATFVIAVSVKCQLPRIPCYSERLKAEILIHECLNLNSI